MFNAEKLLGGLLNGGMSSRSDLPVGALGMGVLGVAFAAADHFLNKDKQPQTVVPGGVQHPAMTPPPGAPVPPGQAGMAPPPPPPAPAPASQATPPPPVQSAASDSPNEENAILLIRAMIASANADGVIDAEEFMQIMDRLEQVGLSTEERDFLKKEMKNPLSAEAITEQALAAGLAQEVYAASLLAITIDTQAEQDYLDSLRGLLNLSQEQADRLHAELSK